MSLQPSQLPDDAASLKQIITSQQQQIDHLQEMLRLLQNELFGRKSERHPAVDKHQLPLFTPAAGWSNLLRPMRRLRSKATAEKSGGVNRCPITFPE